jgi:hypothetical protein
MDTKGYSLTRIFAGTKLFSGVQPKLTQLPVSPK